MGETARNFEPSPTPTTLREQLQKTLGDGYRIDRELGGGGMSRVFVADEVRLDRKVVVKVLAPDLAQGLSADRFEREIRTVASLQQANIVPVLMAGETDGLPFYTMPFVEGESLRAHLARGPLSITDVVGIMKDVAKALAYAHQRGVVHRDIKPDNVLLSGGTAVVTDFGIAKAVAVAKQGNRPENDSSQDSFPSVLTSLGTSIGTPAYMAPEQAAGDPNVDHRADIYALGVMTYELLAGQPLFGTRPPARLLAAHMGEAPRPITELRVDVPTALAELVMRCLAKDPNDRPQTASDITRVLDTVTSGGNSLAMPAVLLGGPAMFRRALAIYAAAFIVVAILAKAAIVGIGLPDWVFSGSLVVMGLGLPVVLWTGYVQRVTRRALTATPTYTPGGTPSTTHGTLANIALKAAPHVSWYRTARGGAYALGVFVVMIAAFMTLRALGIGPFGSLLAAGRLSGRDPILLTDFKTNADSLLGRVVSDAVRAGLSGSSAFTIMAPAAIVASLERMQRPKDSRVDYDTAREIAQREGLKAIVDGEVTRVDGGDYIVSLRLVRADSGIELAAFHETGSGPRGLIDAADKLARALRARAGESLREVNATPALARATTSSLEALRKHSEAVRANSLGDERAVVLAREAVALDSTFASAWSSLGAGLSNYGGSQSAIDSAISNAYRYRERLPIRERLAVTGRYFSLGPGRDRRKAIAAYESLLQMDTTSGALVNIGEQLRSRREFARAESLNVVAIRVTPGSATAYGNAIEIMLDQGKVKEAAALNERLKDVSPNYAVARAAFVLYAQGNDRELRALVDSTMRVGGELRRRIGLDAARGLALYDGRLCEYETLTKEAAANRASPLSDDILFGTFYQIVVKGPTPADGTRLDSLVATIPFRELPFVDRPYLGVAIAYARAGNPDKARAMVARYQVEMTDTSVRRVQEPGVHQALAEIALASGKPEEALAEFRKGDVAYDGGPAGECAPCLPFSLARAYDAAGKLDSAAMMFEQYLATPYWLKPIPQMDPLRVPAIRERLGQLYESLGRTDKAIEQYRLFIALWKNADPELQPRVADAKRRLAKLTEAEPRR